MHANSKKPAVSRESDQKSPKNGCRAIGLVAETPAPERPGAAQQLDWKTSRRGLGTPHPSVNEVATSRSASQSQNASSQIVPNRYSSCDQTIGRTWEAVTLAARAARSSEDRKQRRRAVLNLLSHNRTNKRRAGAVGHGDIGE